jgi:hypothetical protein
VGFLFLRNGSNYESGNRILAAGKNPTKIDGSKVRQAWLRAKINVSVSTVFQRKGRTNVNSAGFWMDAKIIALLVADKGQKQPGEEVVGIGE